MRDRDVYRMLSARCTAHKYMRLLPHDITWAWKDACSRILALCADLQIDPRLYIESVVQTVAWFCHKSKLPLQPNQTYGANAARRYNEWLERSRKHVASATSSRILSLARDRIMEGEAAYVEIYAVTQGMPNDMRNKFAKEAARKVFPRWRTCRLRRLCALVGHFHQLDPRIPDILVTDDHWTTAGLFTVVERMI